MVVVKEKDSARKIPQGTRTPTPASSPQQTAGLLKPPNLKAGVTTVAGIGTPKSGGVTPKVTGETEGQVKKEAKVPIKFGSQQRQKLVKIATDQVEGESESTEELEESVVLSINEVEKNKNTARNGSKGTAWYTQFTTFFEVEFPMDPELVFNYKDSLIYFGCKVLALLSLQLMFIVALVIAQMYQTFQRDLLFALIHLALYLVMYIFVRALHCGHKFPDNLLICGFMTYFLVALIGNLVHGNFAYVLVIYLFVMICTLWNLIVLTLSCKIDLRGFGPYIGTLVYFVMFSFGVTVSTVFFLDKPGLPYYYYFEVGQVLLYFPAFLAYSVSLIFEFQRALVGRRIPLKCNQWAVVTMILPLSIFYPAYLTRYCKCKCWRSSSVSSTKQDMEMERPSSTQPNLSGVTMVQEKSTDNV